MQSSTKIPSDIELAGILARIAMLDDSFLCAILNTASREQSFLFADDYEQLQSWACFIRALRRASAASIENDTICQ